MTSHRLNHFLISISCALLLLNVKCTHNDTLAGATTETTNGISGFVVDESGKRQANAVVKIFSDSTDPLSAGTSMVSFTDTTNDSGMYEFRKISRGAYVVVARHSASQTCFLEKNVIVDDSDVTTVQQKVLEKPGSIIADFSGSTLPESCYVYIPGTDIYSYVNSSGRAFLSNVPKGTFSRIIFASANSISRNILKSGLTVGSSDTVNIEKASWNYSRKIVLNTSASGAGVNETVYGFPLLVRLDETNFDFAQAGNDGNDILFTDRNSRILASETERWDASAKKAEIWVRTDTVFGNDSLQSITMYWGNVLQASKLKNSAVFDTSEGYQGVWHLGDKSKDTVQDATVNKYTGISQDSTSPDIADGIIGNCRRFNGINDFITMPNTAESRLDLPENSNYTVSAWAYLDTLNNASHLIVSKGYEQYFLRLTYFPTYTPLWEFVEFNTGTNWQALNNTAASKKWTLVTGVKNGTNQYLYCDGVLTDSIVEHWPQGLSRDTTKNLSIGKFLEQVTFPLNDGYCFFKGAIDEVRIANKAVSSDWIRLTYMNQRSDDKLLIFK